MSLVNIGNFIFGIQSGNFQHTCEPISSRKGSLWSTTYLEREYKGVRRSNRVSDGQHRCLAGCERFKAQIETAVKQDILNAAIVAGELIWDFHRLRVKWLMKCRKGENR